MVVAAAGPRMGCKMDLTSTITLSTLNPDTTKNTIILFASDILINTAEIDRLVSLNLFDELIIHELGLALGIGSRYWGLNDLNDGSDEYTGLAEVLLLGGVFEGVQEIFLQRVPPPVWRGQLVTGTLRV